MTRGIRNRRPLVLTRTPMHYLQCPFLLTTDALGHDRQWVGLLLGSDEDGDGRGGRDLPEEAAHSLGGPPQQGGHVLRRFL